MTTIIDRLSLADRLIDLAGPEFDVELDNLLADESLPEQYRLDVAQLRDDLITELTGRISQLRGHLDKRQHVLAERGQRAQFEIQQEQQRAREQQEATERRQVERRILAVARRRADTLGVTLEPIRVQHTQVPRPGHLGETVTDLGAWRVTTRLDSARGQALTPDELAHMVRTIDRESVELARGTLRACCEWLASAAANQPETPITPEPEPEPEPKKPHRRFGRA